MIKQWVPNSYTYNRHRGQSSGNRCAFCK